MTSILLLESCDESCDKVESVLKASRKDLTFHCAATDTEARQVLSTVPFDVVILDREFPGMDDFALLQQLKDDYPVLPIVLLLHQSTPEDVLLGLQNGATTYVDKSESATETLSEAVTSVLSATRRQRDRRMLLAHMKSSCNEFEIGNDVGLITAVQDRILDTMKMFGICDDGDEMRVCLVLEEALCNAIYHGNLGLESSLKELEGDVFEQTAAERKDMAPWNERRVNIVEHASSDEVIIQITDEGAGFDVSNVADCTDPDNIGKASGRGLMIMRAFMDEVSFNDAGNQVTLIKRRKVTECVPADEERELVESAPN